jgi:hypothetical protein
MKIAVNERVMTKQCEVAIARCSSSSSSCADSSKLYNLDPILPPVYEVSSTPAVNQLEVLQKLRELAEVLLKSPKI